MASCGMVGKPGANSYTGPAGAGSSRRWCDDSGAVRMARAMAVPARFGGTDRGVHRGDVQSGRLAGIRGGRAGAGGVGVFAVPSGEGQSRLGKVFPLHLGRAGPAVVQAWLRTARYARHQLLRFYGPGDGADLAPDPARAARSSAWDCLRDIYSFLG